MCTICTPACTKIWCQLLCSYWYSHVAVVIVLQWVLSMADVSKMRFWWSSRVSPPPPFVGMAQRQMLHTDTRKAKKCFHVMSTQTRLIKNITFQKLSEPPKNKQEINHVVQQYHCPFHSTCYDLPYQSLSTSKPTTCCYSFHANITSHGKTTSRVRRVSLNAVSVYNCLSLIQWNGVNQLSYIVSRVR